jgi:hypothetical protein
VILTLTVQVPPPTSEPPENEIEALPAVGLNVGVPQLFVVALGVAATFIAPGEIGKVSVKAKPAKGVDAFGLVIVKVSVEVPPARIGDTGGGKHHQRSRIAHRAWSCARLRSGCPTATIGIATWRSCCNNYRDRARAATGGETAST